MSVVIRLTQIGRKGERRFRVIVKEKRSRRDGAAIETIGWFEKNEGGIRKNIDVKRFKYWISQGAMPSPTLSKIMNS